RPRGRFTPAGTTVALFRVDGRDGRRVATRNVEWSRSAPSTPCAHAAEDSQMEGVVQGIMKYSAFVSTLALALGLGGTALAQEMPSESQQSPEAQGQQQPSQQQQQPSQQEPSAEQQQSSQAGVIEIEQLSAEQRKEIQQKLKEQGHYQGAVDGVIGPQTVTALREFQEQNQIEANGQL